VKAAAKRGIRARPGGWLLLACLVTFGLLGSAFIASGITRTTRGIMGFALGLVLILGVGGLAAPAITRALRRH
jgi:hypothetical protein